jgi:hypothetical protein
MLGGDEPHGGAGGADKRSEGVEVELAVESGRGRLWQSRGFLARRLLAARLTGRFKDWVFFLTSSAKIQ